MAQEWFVIRGGKDLGPFTPLQLKEMAASGRLSPADQVRRGDMPTPRAAVSIKGLFPSKTERRESEPEQPSGLEKVAPPRPSGWKATLGERWKGLTKSKRIGLAAGGGVLVIMFLCCGGLSMVALVGGKIKSNSSKKDDISSAGGTASKHSDQNPATNVALKPVNLSDGRVPVDTFIESLKRTVWNGKNLQINTPKEGADVTGTPLQSVGDALGEKCRANIGGYEQLGKKVSFVIFHTVKDGKVAGMMIGTPHDVSKPVGNDNNLDLIVSFVRDIVPAAEVRKIIGEESVKLAFGKMSEPRPYGKAFVAIKFTKAEFQVFVTVSD